MQIILYSSLDTKIIIDLRYVRAMINSVLSNSAADLIKNHSLRAEYVDSDVSLLVHSVLE